MEPVLLEKEAVKDLTFWKSATTSPSEDIRKKLEEATFLGNSLHHKVGIIFEDDEGIKQINTTIWATGQKFICIKGGMWIPIDHILEIKL
ncbi:MAG TPA: hypothetical protein PLP27_01980 [Crocinitomicaceae bacterium]|nr:hypothetical protein [Crocinitomicaceae bacterium]